MYSHLRKPSSLQTNLMSKLFFRKTNEKYGIMPAYRLAQAKWFSKDIINLVVHSHALPIVWLVESGILSQILMDDGVELNPWVIATNTYSSPYSLSSHSKLRSIWQHYGLLSTTLYVSTQRPIRPKSETYTDPRPSCTSH
jgi:hypothetical protein